MVARKTTVDRRSVEPDLARILIDGHVYQADSAGRLLPCPSLNDFRAAWAESGPELTAAHVAKSPGTRPWAWWAFSCQSPPSWTWDILLVGWVDGVPARNRNRPSDHQQYAHLLAIGELSEAEQEAVRRHPTQCVLCTGAWPKR